MKITHQIHEDFFEKIESEAQAYWLGFIAADGGVYKNHLRVSLEESDATHVGKLRTALKAETVPMFRRTFRNKWNTKPQLTLDITRKKLVRDLAQWGVVPRKTTKGWAPVLFPSNLQRHFWRGVFDGDGHISKLADGSWGIGMCGNIRMAEAFAKFLEQELDIPAPTVHAIRRKTGNLPPVCFRVVIQGRAKPKKVIDLLYKNASADCVLDRKMTKALELMAEET